MPHHVIDDGRSDFGARDFDQPLQARRQRRNRIRAQIEAIDTQESVAVALKRQLALDIRLR